MRIMLIYWVEEYIVQGKTETSVVACLEVRMQDRQIGNKFFETV
jgi:hypothetical protein